LNLGVFHRRAHVVTMKEALGWSTGWILLGLSFTVFIYFGYENHWVGLGSSVDALDGRVNDGRVAAIKYLPGYVVEKSRRTDNIFVSLRSEPERPGAVDATVVSDPVPPGTGSEDRLKRICNGQAWTSEIQLDDK